MAADKNPTAVAAQEKAKEKRTTVAVSLTKELFDRLEEYRWANRIDTKGGVLLVALEKLLAGSAVEAAPAE